jgi:hypothetical protein
MRLPCICTGFMLLIGSSFAVPRAHTVILGQWRSVEVLSDSGDKRPMKIRELIIDGRTREYATGFLHEVTDRLFVVRRAYRINDALPEEKKPQQWVWRLDGWISVDRQTGHVTQLNLPAFDGETLRSKLVSGLCRLLRRFRRRQDLSRGFTTGQAQGYPEEGISWSGLRGANVGAFSQSCNLRYRRREDQLCGTRA